MKNIVRLVIWTTEEHNGHLEFFLIFGYEYHLIAKCPKPPKENEKQRKQVHFNEKDNCACDNGKNNDDQKIYASMARMSSNDESSSEKYIGSLQLTT